MGSQMSESVEKLIEKLQADLQKELDANQELQGHLKRKAELEGEETGIGEGIAQLEAERTRIANEIKEKRSTMHFNPLKVLKINKEIADLENTLRTTDDSIKTMRKALQDSESELAKKKEHTDSAIRNIHRKVEMEFRKDYQEKVENLMRKALEICEAYRPASQQSAFQYGFDYGAVEGDFLSPISLKMGNYHTYEMFMSLPMRLR